MMMFFFLHPPMQKGFFNDVRCDNKYCKIKIEVKSTNKLTKNQEF